MQVVTLSSKKFGGRLYQGRAPPPTPAAPLTTKTPTPQNQILRGDTTSQGRGLLPIAFFCPIARHRPHQGLDRGEVDRTTQPRVSGSSKRYYERVRFSTNNAWS